MAHFHLNEKDWLNAVSEEVNPKPQAPAIVFNSHITALAVARSLGKRGVPIIALDREPDGYGIASRYVTVAGKCPNVLTDESAFIATLIALGQTLTKRGVLYPTNDEWVLAVNRHRAVLEPYFIIPFSGPEIVEPLLDKSQLYRTATERGIPIPRTWYLDDGDRASLIASVPYPCIVKPVEQRSFYEAFGVKVWQVATPEELQARLDEAGDHLVVIQEIIGEGLSDFYSVCPYIGLDGQSHGVFVGRKLEQYPPDFGTGCLVQSAWVEDIAQQGTQILTAFGYQGIAEVEFIFDARDGTHKLLDVNTRVWKWIGLPIAAGVDLPWLAYTDAMGTPVHAGQPRDDLIWTYAKDYLTLRLAGYGQNSSVFFPEEAWAEILTGQGTRWIDAVIDPSDPDPAARMLQSTVQSRRYYCAC